MLWRSCPAPNVGGDPFNIHQQAVDKELRKHFSLSDKDIRTAAALAPEVVFPRPPVWTAPPPGPWSAGPPEPPKNAAASSRRSRRRTGLSQRGSLRLPPPDQEKYTRLSASSSRWRSCPPWGFSGPTFSSCSFCCNDRQRNKKRTAPKFGAVLFTFQRSL